MAKQSRRLAALLLALLILNLWTPGLTARALRNSVTLYCASLLPDGTAEVEVRVSGGEAWGGKVTLGCTGAELQSAVSGCNAVLNPQTGELSFAGNGALEEGAAAAVVTLKVTGENPTVTVTALSLTGSDGRELNSSLPQQVLSLSAPCLALEARTARPGGTVRVPLTLTGSGITGGQLALTYDPAVLTPGEVLSGDVPNLNANVVRPGLMKLSWADTRPAPDGVTLCTLPLAVSSRASGTGRLCLSDAQLVDTDARTVTPVTRDGVLTFSRNAVEQPTLTVVPPAASFHRGDSVDVRVRLDHPGTVTGVVTDLCYDTRLLTLDSMEAVMDGGLVNPQCPNKAPGTARITVASAAALPSGDLAVLHFRVTSGACGGFTPIRLTDCKVYTGEDQLLDHTALDGRVSIDVPQEEVPRLIITGGAADSQGNTTTQVVLENAALVSGATFNFHYDASCTIKEIRPHPGVKYILPRSMGTIQCTLEDGQTLEPQAVLLEVDFEHAKPGSTIQLDDVQMQDHQQQPLVVPKASPAVICSEEIKFHQPTVRNVTYSRGTLNLTLGLSATQNVPSMTMKVELCKYRDGRFLGVEQREVTGRMENKTCTLDLTVNRVGPEDEVKVLLLDGTFRPLTSATPVSFVP